MDFEKKTIKLLINGTEILTTELFLYDEMPDNQDMVLLEMSINGKQLQGINDNFFDASKELRKLLEKENIQIMCNGAAKNVYPSPMQFSMGNTRKAYKISIGQQARIDNMVDIFECEEGWEFVSINEQLEFYEEWTKS